MNEKTNNACVMGGIIKKRANLIYANLAVIKTSSRMTGRRLWRKGRLSMGDCEDQASAQPHRFMNSLQWKIKCFGKLKMMVACV